MAVTRTEIDELKKARALGTVDALIEKWERNLRARALTKKDSVQFNLTNQKTNAVAIVVGKRIAEHYAFHKDAWGGSFYRLTHIDSGIVVLSGKRSNVIEATNAFASWSNLEQLTAALTDHGIKALTVLPQELRDECRKFYEHAAGM